MSKLSTFVDRVRGDYLRHGARMENPALWALAVYRFGVYSNELGDGLLGKATSKLYGVLFLGIELVSGIVINREARIGEDFHLVHSGNIKIHPSAVIGDRCGIMHDVTLGTNGGRDGAPRIGNGVFIGAGAKILGPVTIGDGAVIAANSVVLTDVPPGATAIGVPARIVQFTGRAPATAAAPAAVAVVAAAAAADRG